MNYDQWLQTKLYHIEYVLMGNEGTKPTVMLLIESLTKEAWNKGYEQHLLEMTEALEQLGISEKEQFDEDDTFGYEYYR